MDCGEVSVEGVQMVACELEAAEALAELARCSALPGGALGSGELERQHVTEAVVTPTRPSEDQPVAEQQICGYASNTITNVENIPSQLCSTSSRSNSVKKLRRKLTEAEKEAGKLRRILANRESARQTIRRRQAMHKELTRKAADLLEENENLKKEKELTVEKHNSLVRRNEFLKAQMAKIKKAGTGDTQEDSQTSQAEKSCSIAMSTPIFLHNQPSIVPCFWPSTLCASHPNVMSSSQFPMPNRDITCSHQGQENSIGNTRPATPLFLLPAPWLLSCLTQSGMLHSQSGTNHRKDTHHCSTCSCLEKETLPQEDNNRLSSNQKTRAEASCSRKTGFTFPPDGGGEYTADLPEGTMLVPGLFSRVRPLESSRPSRNNQVEDTSVPNVVSEPEIIRNGLSQKNQERVSWPHKKSEDVFAATVARRRRKELMKLKNIHCDH